MITRRWAVTSGSNKGAKIEERKYRDGSFHYSMRDKFGRPSDIKDEAEALKLVKIWGMEEV